MSTLTSAVLSACVLSACVLSATATAIDVVPANACDSDVPYPTSVQMNCSALIRNTCVLHKGSYYTLQATFTPEKEVEDVESSVVWKSWLEMPLPGQNPDACDGPLQCPLQPGQPATFTYNLFIEKFWMRRRYPLMWRLRDDDSDDVILCFNMRIQIVD